MDGIDVEILIVGDEVRLLVPKQPGLSFAAAAPALRRFAEQLSVEMQLPVRLEGEVEMHTHGPEGLHQHQGQRAHQH